MTFKEDLVFGEKYQTIFLNMIEWERSEIAKGCFKAWDIKIWNDKTKEDDFITFEVKADRKASRTGNLAIEFECNGKDSGITSTESDYWVHFVVGSPFYYFIPIDILRRKIENKEYTRIVNGGDCYRSRMYLFEMLTFNDYKELISPKYMPLINLE